MSFRRFCPAGDTKLPLVVGTRRKIPITIFLTMALALIGRASFEPLPAQSQGSHPADFVWIEGESANEHDFNQHGWYSSQNLRMDILSPGDADGQDGAWLAHYSNGPSQPSASYSFGISNENSYRLWIRASVFQTRMWYSIDGGPRVQIDSDNDQREYLRLNDPTSSGPIDIRFLAWLKLDQLQLDAGQHVLEIGLEPLRQGGQETHGGIDIVFLTAGEFEPTGALRPDQIPEPASDAWFPLLPRDDPFSEESLTDLSALSQGPAGSNGHIRRVEDRLELADGRPIKFWGVNSSIPTTDDLMRRQARFMAKHGINLVRIHPVQDVVGLLEPDGQGGRQLNPDRLARLDLYLSILAEQGIYWQFSPFYPHVITEADGYPGQLYSELPNRGPGKNTSGFANFMPELQAAQWEWLQALMNHTNPHRSMAYKDDPALAIVEVHNEDSIFWHFPLNGIESGEFPNHKAALQRMWMEWLQAKYNNSSSALHAAWGPVGNGRRGGDAIDNPSMDIYGAWQMEADGPWQAKAETARMGDYIQFLAETQRRFFEGRQEALRDLGYQAVTVGTAWMAGGPAGVTPNLWVDDGLDMIDRHRYFGGHNVEGQSTHRIAAGPIRNASHLAQPGSGILSAGFEQIEDKPFMVSEWTQSPPNQWKAEIAPLYAFYGMGLHGWDASTHFHSSLPRMGGGWPSDMNSYVTETPHYIGQFPALARAIHEGHLSAGPPAALRRMNLGAAAVAGRDPRAFTNNWNDGSADNLSLPPETFAIGRVANCLEPFRENRESRCGNGQSQRSNWSDFWDRSSQRIESSSQELLWDYGERMVEVNSPRTQGIIGFAEGSTIELPFATVEVATPFLSLLFTSLDQRPLVESGNILVTALARDRQTGARYNSEGLDATQLLNFGAPPLWMEPVQASIQLNTSHNTNPAEMHVLDIHGVPTGETVSTGHDDSRFRIDGRVHHVLVSHSTRSLNRSAANGSTSYPLSDAASNDHSSCDRYTWPQCNTAEPYGRGSGREGVSATDDSRVGFNEIGRHFALISKCRPLFVLYMILRFGLD